MIPSDFTSALLDAHENRAKILIVDDEVVNRILLTRIFKNQHQLAEADGAHAALSLLQEKDFDLILLDIMMPEMNGLEVLRIIRGTPKLAQTPVILISALSQTADIVSGLHMGANDYITKPIDVEVVLARVETQLKLKRMMDLQKRVVAEFEQSQMLKDRLLRIASHDLRSPLMNIHMVETLLRDTVANDSEASGLLDMLQHTVFYMNEIIEEFLDVAACQSGRIELQLRAVELRDVISRVIDEFGVMAQRKAISVNLGQLPGVVLADPSRVIQIVSNLVSNAIKYSPHNTRITVWADCGAGFVRCYVADEGPGIPQAERDRLFTEFGKLTPRPTGNESSTGLGLWIVKHMVLLHGGAVGVDCPDTGGSIFWFDLPAYQGQ